jgi:hypothetical protein
MDQDVQAYIDRINPQHRPLFDRVHAPAMAAYPTATVSLPYRMPSYRAGGRRLHLGVWRHGVSLYGWPQGQDGGFTARHPALLTGKATIRIRPLDAMAVSDAELSALIRATLEA